MDQPIAGIAGGRDHLNREPSTGKVAEASTRRTRRGARPYGRTEDLEGGIFGRPRPPAFGTATTAARLDVDEEGHEGQPMSLAIGPGSFLLRL